MNIPQTLHEYFNIKLGKKLNLKDYKEGSTIIHKNGTKTYNKEITSNLPDEECILITAMSIDILYIEKENTKKHYASAGCFILTIKPEYKSSVILKYLFYCFKAFGIDKALMDRRTGALQQSINTGRLVDTLKSVIMNPV
tara:strand:+ start:210 stop:629 length:420 start_codon:yes stop_codon:yes gene_type:complete